ncbi:hypothetical protein Pan258_01840 [Symmachiella dynata]|uniref:hypothetical protein n=1 Tax=Symmachiella dynata TaxID=2527995 RepID=UPI001188CE89|nr:hypothetical protein [Symmachiella dynata]QDT46167.1 hypothetical protein Pan258_01840 [Symmachiella dynata]
METNATVTIKRRGDKYSQTTGRRESKPQVTILSAVDCVFTQPRSSNRQRYQNGQRDVLRPIYSVLIPEPTGTDLSGIFIEPGDQATVVLTVGENTISYDFDVADAIFANGISETHWEVTLEGKKTAKP